MTIVIGVTAGACTDLDEPATAEHESAVTTWLAEDWNAAAAGSVGGYNGWRGNCTVSNEHGRDKYLACAGDRSATKDIGLHGAGSYTMQVDLSPNAKVVDATHGTIALDGPQGRAFQITVGCDSIRMVFQTGGPSALLGTLPCGALTGPPHYRVLCRWSTEGTALTCGASELPVEPTRFVTITLPSGMRPFSTVAISTFALPGATLFDKTYIWQN